MLGEGDRSASIPLTECRENFGFIFWVFCYACLTLHHADMAELVDALGLGSSFLGSEGSNPFIRIRFSL